MVCVGVGEREREKKLAASEIRPEIPRCSRFKRVIHFKKKTKVINPQEIKAISMHYIANFKKLKS